MPPRVCARAKGNSIRQGLGRVSAALAHFRVGTRGNVATILGLAIVPLAVFVGGTIDYGRKLSVRTQLQNAVDTSVLAGANNSYSVNTAAQAFQAAAKMTVADPSTITYSAVSNGSFTGSVATDPNFSLQANFTSNSNGSMTGTVTATMPTSFLALAGIHSMSTQVTSTVSGGGPELDCIIALGNGGSTSNQAINLDGAPVVNLRGCSIRSNQSMVCNGHNGNATSSIAVGTASACSNPIAKSAIPDIYASLASNITAKCGANVTGVSWTASSSPTIPASSMISVAGNGYTEYHVCGDLNLNSTGTNATLTGASPTTDTVVVIENGSINVADSSAITANRMTFVFTGSDLYNHTINFPNGNGHLATLNIEPSQSSSNPWVGVSLYQDPAVSKNVNVNIGDIYSTDNVSWGPGGALNVDGVAYLPHANVTISGNAGSANAPCTVFVVSSFTTNGSVNLNFQQNQTYCKNLGVKQYSFPIALTQ